MGDVEGWVKRLMEFLKAGSILEKLIYIIMRSVRGREGCDLAREWEMEMLTARGLDVNNEHADCKCLQSLF